MSTVPIERGHRETSFGHANLRQIFEKSTLNFF